MTRPLERIELPRPYAKQQEFLRLSNRTRAFIAGVGSGKTFTLCLDAVLSALRQPSVMGGIFFPSLVLWEDVGLPTWEEIVPPDLYRWNRYRRRIEMANGAQILVKGLDRSRQRIKGLNLGWAAMDEVAVQKNDWAVRLVGQRIRAGRPSWRHLDLFTSPSGYAWLKVLCDRPHVGVVNATTYDNADRLGRDYIDALELDFPPGTPEHAQEMLGQFVSRHGYVYGDIFSRQIHLTEWSGDPLASYVLSVDFGWRASAWLIWQRRRDGQWVVVGEDLPENELTEDTALRIRRTRGQPPLRVYCDVPATRPSSRITQRARLNDDDVLREVFGTRTSVDVVGGYERDSDWRHKAVVAGLTSRRLQISRDLVHSAPRPAERGLVHALEACEWPAESTRDERRDDRDRLKHVLDALEFGAVHLTPPRLGRPQDRYAATLH